MVIDFNKITEKEVDGFKGGNGPFHTRCADDGKVKIMYNTLLPGSSIGLHTHEVDFEVMYVLKGELTFIADGKEETAQAGCVHYCPQGMAHTAVNRTDKPVTFFAVVAK